MSAGQVVILLLKVSDGLLVEWFKFTHEIYVTYPLFQHCQFVSLDKNQVHFLAFEQLNSSLARSGMCELICLRFLVLYLFAIVH